MPGSIIISTRLCLDPLRGGTGVATLSTSLSASLSASLNTAFLAYARACARVRGGPNSCGGVKAVAPRTATRRRATTTDGMAVWECGVLRNQARVSSTTHLEILLGLTMRRGPLSMRVIAPLHPWFELRVTALQIQLEDGAKCTTRQEITILSAGLSKRSFVLTDPAARASRGNPLIFPRREPVGWCKPRLSTSPRTQWWAGTARRSRQPVTWSICIAPAR